ncbi:MAG: 50S ribosomal protein L18 [Candidatus Micrarchaeaceae archaeon]
MEKRINSIKQRRRREGLTDYSKRLALVKSGMLRVIVRKTNRRIIGQIAKYREEGDSILKTVTSDMLNAYGWPARANKPTAYLTGLLLAKRSKDLKENNFIIDAGLATFGKNSVGAAFAKGFVDGGMQLRATLSIDENAYNCGWLSAYAKSLKESNPERYKRQFSSYIKDGALENIKAKFDETKSKILNSQGE